MLKPFLFGLFLLTSLCAVSLARSDNGNKKTWDETYMGYGDPTAQGWIHHGSNYHSFNARFTPPNTVAGWVTGTGNTGGYWSKPMPAILNAIRGWTFEWSMQTRNTTPMPYMDSVILLQDNASQIRIGYDTSQNTITLSDHKANKTVRASIALHDGAGNNQGITHTYTLVRQPRDSALSLYIDHDYSKPLLQLELTSYLGSSRGEVIKIFESGFESAWDYWRFKSGADLPKTKYEKSRPILGEPDLSRAGGKDYLTYVMSPAITNEPLLKGHPLPSACITGRVMKVHCARGEYEPASFLIESGKPLEQVMVQVSDLSGDAGVLPSEIVDVRIVQKTYRTSTWGNVTMPWILVHDPHMLEIIDKPAKWVSDLTNETYKSPVAFEDYKARYSKMMRLNKELIDTDVLQPSDIEDYRQFWLTVHVPDDAESGTYHAKVTITANNAEPTILNLEVTVPSFDLLPPKFEYSVYFPTMVKFDHLTDEQFAQVAKYNPVSEQQYLAELQNMAAHGCLNPNIYQGPERDETGNIHFTKLSRILDLREQAGMPKGVTLYIFEGAGMQIKEGRLTDQEKNRSIEATQATMAWAKSRGYQGVLFMGADERSGDGLLAMRESYKAIADGGSGVWVAGWEGLVNDMSDAVKIPIFAHPGAMAADQYVQWQVGNEDWILRPEMYPNWDINLMLTPEIQGLIKKAHQYGNKIFTYFDPQGGQPFPEYHRRHRGMGLWKIGLDGTMTWAYFHVWQETPRMDSADVQQNGLQYLPSNAFVVRGPAGPLDTLGWEGYREGYDDARYLATLEDAMANAQAQGRHRRLVSQTKQWLRDVDVNDNLNAWRLEMSRRISLLKVGVHSK